MLCLALPYDLWYVLDYNRIMRNVVKLQINEDRKVYLLKLVHKLQIPAHKSTPFILFETKKFIFFLMSLFAGVSSPHEKQLLHTYLCSDDFHYDWWKYNEGLITNLWQSISQKHNPNLIVLTDYKTSTYVPLIHFREGEIAYVNLPKIRLC